jgi:hypothetical protein
MFLIKDSSLSREEEIRQILNRDPSLASLLAVIHFEWTIRRSIIALGESPNVKVREKLQSCHGHDKYKDVWKDEVFPKVQLLLPKAVKDWESLVRSFKLRHKLVHGISACGYGYAKDRVDGAINAAVDIREICVAHKVDLDSRLPVRRHSKS